MKQNQTKKLSVLVGAALAAFIAFGPSVARASTCGQTTWDLWAGQTIDAGSIIVTNDADYLYVTYQLGDPDGYFGTLHLWVGGNLEDVPANNQAVPVPGQFPYKSGSDGLPSAEGLSEYTFSIPFNEINVTGLPSGDGCQALTLYVVAHAEVWIDPDGDGTFQKETAFGGDHDQNVGSPGRWWYYAEYGICCDFGGGDPCFTSTAFGKGGYVWTTTRRANPEGLPSLDLTRNRWGWAINLTESGESNYDIWAGAGLNETSNGQLIGSLSVFWDGTEAELFYLLDPGFFLEEVHIYAGDAEPNTIAPGQYGYPSEGYDVGGVLSFGYTVPLADVDGDGSVWLVAHAAISSGSCQD